MSYHTQQPDRSDRRLHQQGASGRCQPGRTRACSDDPMASDTSHKARNSPQPENARWESVLPRIRFHEPLRLGRRGSQHFLQCFSEHWREFLPPAFRSAQDTLASPAAQIALLRRVRLQNRRLSRYDFDAGARPSVPPPKRAMQGRNRLPRSRRCGAIFLSEVQEQKGYHCRGR